MICTGKFMPFIDIAQLPVRERLPGWFGRYFHSANMTFAHYEFLRGASIHEHFHPEEEVYEVIEGELEITVEGKSQVAKQGFAAIVPAGARHSVNALTDGRAIIIDHPVRPDFS
jgi:quercetin dioxygenase-like cupin family protein